MRNEVVVINEACLELTDNVINLRIKEPELKLIIKGQVLINELFDNLNINQKLTIEMAPKAHLLFNYLALNKNTKRQIIINQTDNSQLTFNYAYLTKAPTELELVININGNHNDNQININAVNIAAGQTTVTVTGTIAQQTKGNQVSENISCLTLNNAPHKIRPNLIVNAGDCVVTHNATINPLDPQEKFYLASKGLAPEVINKLLIKGFLSKKLYLEQTLINEVNERLETELSSDES